jgi:hypothetical protein
VPYKASLKSGARRQRPKPTYRVANARAYNQSLKRRGQLSLYCLDGELKALFINARPYVPGVSGRAPTYTNAYIELIYTFYRLFRWAIRQITGFMEEYWRLCGLEIAVPSFGQLSERFATLTVSVQQRCERVAGHLANGEAIRA